MATVYEKSVSLSPIYLPNEQAGRDWAAQLAPQLPRSGFISLVGPLGAGKSHFARSTLQALGHSGAVPSPTYTLVEHYASIPAFHLDLYRLGDPEELEFLNMREAIASNALCLIEWAEKGAGWLPPAQLELAFDYQGEGRVVRISGPALESLSLPS